MDKKEFLKELRRFKPTDTIGDVIKNLEDDESRLEETIKELKKNIGKYYYIEATEIDDYSGAETLSKNWYRITDVVDNQKMNHAMYMCDWIYVSENNITFTNDITLLHDDIKGCQEIPKAKFGEVVFKYNELLYFKP